MSRQQRDETFVAFVDARRPGLVRTAYLLCGDWHRAEDLAQQALVKLYLAWPRVVNSGSEEAFLRRVLPEGQRKVVVLRFWLDLSVEQTASDLGVSTGTVKSHSARALARLRSLVGDSDEAYKHMRGQ